MNLPVMVPERQSYGLTRTSCDCETCSVNCRFVPGFLSPPDLWRLAEAGGVTEGDEPALLAWAEQHLLASPGARVLRRTASGPVLLEIPTLVPARQSDGMACHWLDPQGRCQVHGVSPFGCAFADSHQGEEAGQRVSQLGLQAILQDEQSSPSAPPGLYQRVWRHLRERGRLAPSPSESRRRMEQAIGSAYPEAPPGADTQEYLQRREEQLRQMLVEMGVEVPERGLPDPDLVRRAIAEKFHRPAPAQITAGPGVMPSAGQKIGRNASCPCGSGRKFKKCCASR